MNVSRNMLFAFIALAMSFPLVLNSTVAQAQQPAYAVAAPRIDGFDVEQVRRLSAGSELLFILYGSPGGVTTVRIDGVVDQFRLEEVENGTLVSNS